MMARNEMQKLGAVARRRRRRDSSLSQFFRAVGVCARTQLEFACRRLYFPSSVSLTTTE